MELRPAGATAMEKSTAMPGMHGQFEFGSVKPGHYILPVNNRKGDSRKEEHLFVNSGSDDVTIRLGESKAPEGRGTVNVNLLNHPVPKAAQKAIARFRKCRERQDEACAARYLDEAIAAGPDFSKPM